MRTLITNGLIVTADGSTAADLLIDGETIGQIGRDLAASGVTADETIDAAGKYVIPGGIDAHTHMELPFGGTFAKDTFETGTRAAAFGGTTSIVDFAVQSKGKSLRDGLDAWHARGLDVHSVIADPLFVDASKYDFRLRKDSPALKLGFKPIEKVGDK